MNNIAILTGFTYTNAKDFRPFLHEDIKSDLRRLLLFCNDKIICAMENIYILTDIVPDAKIQANIINNYVQHVKKYFLKKGINNIPNYDMKYKPIDWCYEVAKKYSSVLKIDTKILCREINNTINDDLQTSNIIEFLSCFTSFYYINNKYIYIKYLTKIFSRGKDGYNFFYYFTGHGSYINGISFVIPTGKPSSDFFYGYEVDNILDKYIPPNTKSIFILDCCHSSEIISLQYRVPGGIKSKIERESKKYFGKDIMVISSTIGDEKCGFYNQYPHGSVFTHFFLESCNKKFPLLFYDILSFVQNNINNYRKKYNQSKQTITIQSNNRYILENATFPF